MAASPTTCFAPFRPSERRPAAALPSSLMGWRGLAPGSRMACAPAVRLAVDLLSYLCVCAARTAACAGSMPTSTKAGECLPGESLSFCSHSRKRCRSFSLTWCLCRGSRWGRTGRPPSGQLPLWRSIFSLERSTTGYVGSPGRHGATTRQASVGVTAPAAALLRVKSMARMRLRQTARTGMRHRLAYRLARRCRAWAR